MIEIEAKLLASMILDPACIQFVSRVVTGACFSPPHNHLFGVLRELDERGTPIGSDLVSVVEALKNKGLLERIGGLPYLIGIIGAQCTSAHAVDYAKRLAIRHVDERMRAEVRSIEAVDQMPVDVLQGRLESLVSLAEEKAEAMGVSGGVRAPAGVVGLSQVSERVKKKLSMTSGVDGWSTGWSTLDRILGGWRPGETTAITAHTGAGKSTFASQAAIYQRTQGQRRVFFCPFEGGNDQAVPKLVRQLTAANPRALLRNDPSAFDGALGALGGPEHWATFDHVGSIEPERWKRTLRYVLETMRPDLVVVDHLHFMVDDSDPDELKKIAQITKDTVSLTAQSSAHTLLVCQASKNSQAKRNADDYVPQMRDVKGLTSIIQHVPNIISIYRPRDAKRGAVRNEDGTLQSAAIVLKNREGGREGIIRLRYFEDSQTFRIDPRDLHSQGMFGGSKS